MKRKSGAFARGSREEGEEKSDREHREEEKGQRFCGPIRWQKVIGIDSNFGMLFVRLKVTS